MRARLILALALLAALVPAVDAGAFSNGKARTSELAPIFRSGGPSYLAKDAAPPWNTMRFCAVTRRGQDLYPGGPRSAYRRYADQVYFWNLYRSGRGNLAARPGTSNHGWGRAIDLAAPSMRRYIDRYGSPYRWRKVEAFSEWWHVNYTGSYRLGPDPGTSQRYPILRKGSRYSCLGTAVKEVQRRLGGTPSGRFGDRLGERVRAFQRKHGLKADGIVGERTWLKLRKVTRGVSNANVLEPPERVDRPLVGVDVRAAQGLLNQRFRDTGSNRRIAIDGVLGQDTASAVREFQAQRNLEVDGRVGERTWSELRVPARAPPFTASTLQRAMPGLGVEKARLYAPHLIAAMLEHKITSLPRAQYFLAQLGHESVSLRYFEEIASGAQYEGRRDLGNIYRGDGRRYKGRGPIQLTGRYNYRAAGRALGLNLEGNPTLAATPAVGFRVAGWYWSSRNLNAYADRRDFRGVTRRINGGYNGYSDRVRRLNIIKRLGEAVIPRAPKPIESLTRYERARYEELRGLRAGARRAGGWEKAPVSRKRATKIKRWIGRKRLPYLRETIDDKEPVVLDRQYRFMLLRVAHGDYKTPARNRYLPPEARR